MSRYKKLRVLVLTYSDNLPAATLDRVDPERVNWRLEYDIVSTLKAMEQNVEVLGVEGEVDPIREALAEMRPQVVFNLLDAFDGETLLDHNLVSYLELLGVRYTGCNPRGLVLARDKALTKKLLHYHGIPVPGFAVYPLGKISRRLPPGLSFPLFVKPLSREASLGISQASIVRDERHLADRVAFIHESIGVDAIVESYIEGRELYVSVVGNGRAEVMPVWELRFERLPKDLPRIATSRVKWNPEYRRKYGITTGRARGLSEERETKIRELCRRAYQILGLSGYARFDLRLDQEGKPYILEANANPHLGEAEALAESALEAGIHYDRLLWRVLNLGMTWDPTRQLPAAA